MVLTAILGTGLIYLPQDEDDDLEEKYTPEHFPANDSLVFSISRKSTEVNYASILVVSNTETLLEPEILEEISKVEGAVQALTVTQDNGTQIPYIKQATLVAFLTWKRNKGLNLKTITFPIYSLTCQIIYLANILGGTVLAEIMQLSQAKAMYVSVSYVTHTISELNIIYLNTFMWQVLYFSSLSRQLEFEATSMTVVPLFHLIIIILFAIVSSFGVISAALAVVSSFGLMSYIGVPFMIIVASSPFLILGVGVNGMDSISEQMSNVYSKVAVVLQPYGFGLEE
ncbi:hypothetical protein JEQ12_004227 [Ovis aries]|uniref:SSD domain-containing protein n=1 Tax=Ovis aries TaxID=9940 RepID=A0A836CXQ0_SHEEP|nr:hypothetical protein JEQ12_004227 [Ovis aries]